MGADCILWCPDVQVAPGRWKPSHQLGILYVGRVAAEGGHKVRFIRCGHDVEAVAEEVRRERAGIVGISVTTSDWRSNLSLAAELCGRVKQISRGIRTVLGGIVPTMFAQEILTRYGDVDIVVKGEGEQTFLEILRGEPSSDIAGIAWRDEDGAVRHGPARRPLGDLDELPHAMAVETEGTATTECAGLLGNVYYDSPTRCASLLTSRGCEGQCTFCVNPWYYRPVRQRSIPNVLGEIRRLACHGVRYLRICDANFASDHARVMDFCDAIEPFRMQWSCWQRADMTDPGLYTAMRRAGCRITTIGIESFDQEIRNLRYRKNVPDEQLYQAVRYAAQAGIDTVGEIIIGHPLEDADRLRQGFDKARGILRYLDYVNISTLTVVPHTALWTQLTADMPEDRVAKLRLRSMFQCPSVWRFARNVDPGALESMSQDYLRHVYHGPAYLLRQFTRTLAQRKRLTWFNRDRIVKTLLGKALRRVRRPR